MALVSIGLFEGFANGFIFPLIERHTGGKYRWGSCDGAMRRRVEVNVRGIERGTGGERDAALDDVFEFTHIAGPMEIEQQLHGGGRDAANGLAGFASEFFEEEVRESGDVFLVVAERGNIDRDHVEAVVKVLAKRAVLKSGAKIAVCGGDQSYVHFQSFRAAETFEFAFLQDAQKFHLDGGRDIAYFVEE